MTAPQIGTEREGEHPIGRDPRTMTAAELRQMGHKRLSPMQAIRAHCLDCCAGSAHEVAKCMALGCPSWPFRMGVNPWREVSEARREAGRLAAARLHGARSDPGQNARMPPPVPEYPEPAAGVETQTAAGSGAGSDDLAAG